MLRTNLSLIADADIMQKETSIDDLRFDERSRICRYEKLAKNLRENFNCTEEVLSRDSE